jgi:hypothetical protein
MDVETNIDVTVARQLPISASGSQKVLILSVHQLKLKFETEFIIITTAFHRVNSETQRRNLAAWSDSAMSSIVSVEVKSLKHSTLVQLVNYRSNVMRSSRTYTKNGVREIIVTRTSKLMNKQRMNKPQIPTRS